MTKKIFSAVLIFGIILTSTVAMAARNPRADRSLLLFYQHQGYDYYLERDSLTWYADDDYQYVSFEYFAYDARNSERLRVESMEFAYDVRARRVYFVDQNGELDYLNPYGTIAEGSGYADGAEKIYYLVFGEKFYGTYEEEFYYSFWD